MAGIEPRVFSLETLEEAAAAVTFFNHFHDGFIARLEIVSHDRFEDRHTHHCSGRLDLHLRFAHWNYDFERGARPHQQEVEAKFYRLRDLEIRFGGRETDSSVKSLDIAAATRPLTGPSPPSEPCLRAVLRQPRLHDWKEWRDSDDLVFTFVGGRMREIG